jgi:hypothetical protein
MVPNITALVFGSVYLISEIQYLGLVSVGMFISCFIVILFSALTAPICYGFVLIENYTSSLRLMIFSNSDKRASLLIEMLSGIKLLKVTDCSASFIR